MKINKFELYASAALITLAATIGTGIVLQKESVADHCKEICPITTIQSVILGEEKGVQHQINKIYEEKGEIVDVSYVPNKGIKIYYEEERNEIVPAVVKQKGDITTYHSRYGYKLVGDKCLRTVQVQYTTMIGYDGVTVESTKYPESRVERYTYTKKNK